MNLLKRGLGYLLIYLFIGIFVILFWYTFHFDHFKIKIQQVQGPSTHKPVDFKRDTPLYHHIGRFTVHVCLWPFAVGSIGYSFSSFFYETRIQPMSIKTHCILGTIISFCMMVVCVCSACIIYKKSKMRYMRKMYKGKTDSIEILFPKQSMEA
jgi:hypothetical protein